MNACRDLILRRRDARNPNDFTGLTLEACESVGSKSEFTDGEFTNPTAWCAPLSAKGI
jgi:hypothetical protein